MDENKRMIEYLNETAQVVETTGWQNDFFYTNA